MDALSEWIAALFSVTSAALGCLFLGGAVILRIQGDRSGPTVFGMARGSVYLVEASFVAWILLSGYHHRSVRLALAVVVFIGGQALLKWLARRTVDEQEIGAEQ